MSTCPRFKCEILRHHLWTVAAGLLYINPSLLYLLTLRKNRGKMKVIILFISLEANFPKEDIMLCFCYLNHVAYTFVHYPKNYKPWCQCVFFFF